MFSPSKFIFLCSVIFLISPTISQQTYDRSNCNSSQPQVQGYICSSEDSDCAAYIVYRAQHNYNSITSIASLFSLSLLDLLEANHLKEEDPTNLPAGLELIIPIKCQCHGGFFQAPLLYNFSSKDSVDVVACEIFEGLVKAQNLVQENPDLWGNHPEGYQITVPIRCACPSSIQQRNGVRYLVTYSILEGDNPHLIGYKFGLIWKVITDANNLRRHDAIFPKTTLLIPTNNLTDLNLDIGSVPQISPAPKATFTVVSSDAESTEWTNSHVFLGAGVCFAVITMVISCGIFRNIRRMSHPARFLPLPPRNLMSLNMSPDFLDGVSKLKNSIASYSLEEIRIATEDFSEAARIRKDMYGGRIGNSNLVFERMDSEEVSRNVIGILTKINHFNIVRLEGFCSGSKPYLVLEYAENGSLRNCLSNRESNRQLTWARRLQVAFDLAAALHYLHNSTAPPFVHHNINSSNVLLTINWRAKLSGFSLVKPVIVGTEGKADVYAFGIVLLELVSGKEIVKDDEILMGSINLLLDEKLIGSQSLLENLREFMDPVMEGNYGVGDAISLVLLAKSCIEGDPNHRPTMNDILIALSRIM